MVHIFRSGNLAYEPPTAIANKPGIGTIKSKGVDQVEFTLQGIGYGWYLEIKYLTRYQLSVLVFRSQFLRNPHKNNGVIVGRNKTQKSLTVRQQRSLCKGELGEGKCIYPIFLFDLGIYLKMSQKEKYYLK
jgi:hypothetical protein